jgi:hypothetical protein
MRGSYARFFAMILTSTVIMWGLMYSLVLERDHLRFADTRFFMTSSRAQIRDPRVRKLADGIIAAQRREIAERDSLIHDLERE